MPSPTPDQAPRSADRDAETSGAGSATSERVDRARRTDVRPSAQRPGGPRRPGRAPLVVAAAVAALWAALVSYLPVAVLIGLIQFTEQAATVGGTARTGLAAWLLGHGVPLATRAGSIGIPPLTLALLSAWRVARAGVHVSRAIGARHRGSLRQALAAAAAVGIAYGLLGSLAAALVDGRGMAVSPVRAGATLAVFGVLAALVGALHTTDALGAIARRTPALLRDGLRTGVVGALLLLAAGAVVAGLAVAVGGGDASDLIGAYRAGVAGQAGLTLLSGAYVPNVAVWAASYLLGPGFAVGTGTVVRTTEVTVGALPAVPLMAGLPQGPVGGFGAALLMVPLLAGMMAGWLLVRRRARDAAQVRARSGWAGLLGAAAFGGPVAGGLLGLAAVFSGGPLGGGRLAEIGPIGWQVALAATVVIGLGAMVGAAATRSFTASHTSI